jgi:hypothetical protein
MIDCLKNPIISNIFIKMYKLIENALKTTNSIGERFYKSKRENGTSLYEEAVSDQVPNKCVSSIYTLTC